MGELSEFHARWLESRGIPIEIAARCGLTSHETALGFPYTLNGEIRFTKWRGPAKKFWIDPKGAALILWGLDDLAEADSNTLIVTEGEMDRLAWLSIGQAAVVSMPNGAPGTESDKPVTPENDGRYACLWENNKLLPALQRFERVIISTDADTPGQILGKELATRFGRDRCWYLTYPEDCKDANDVLMRDGRDGLVALLNGARRVVPNRLTQFADIPTDNRVSYDLGWSGLDDHVRLREPELVIISGTPGAGKSQFALNIGANLARLHDLKGAILQFEDHPERNYDDLIRYAEAWRQDIPDPEVWVNAMFRTIAPAETSGEDRYTNAWLRETITEAATVHDCRWVIIDPWNEIEHMWGINENESAYTNRALAELKSLSRLLQITLILVAHPNKAGAAKTDVQEASLYDIAGSSAFKNKADHGIILVRPEGGNEVYVKVDKVKDHRRMGVPGIVRMRFNPKHAAYEFVGKGV